MVSKWVILDWYARLTAWRQRIDNVSTPAPYSSAPWRLHRNQCFHCRECIIYNSEGRFATIVPLRSSRWGARLGGGGGGYLAIAMASSLEIEKSVKEKLNVVSARSRMVLS